MKCGGLLENFEEENNCKQYIISFCLQSAQQKVKKSQRPKKKQDSGMKNIYYFPSSIFDAPLLIRGSISHHTLNQDCNAM